MRLALDDIPRLAVSAGVYAIVRTDTGERYVGKSSNIRQRLKDHFRGLRSGQPEKGDRLLYEAWLQVGPGAFHIEILEFVVDNTAETHYHIRPDNLLLAEQHYVRERSEYNMFRELVNARWDPLIASYAWRGPLDDDTRRRIAEAEPIYTYQVGKRVTQEGAVLVVGFGEVDAKHRARVLSDVIRTFGANLSVRRIKGSSLAAAIAAGARDLRGASARASVSTRDPRS